MRIIDIIIQRLRFPGSSFASIKVVMLALHFGID